MGIFGLAELILENFKLEFRALSTVVFSRPSGAVPWRIPSRASCLSVLGIGL